MNKYLNGWVWVSDLTGYYVAVFNGGTFAISKSAEGAKCMARLDKGWVVCEGNIDAINARPLSFAEYAAIGGDL